ncbi:MAG: NAD(P)/FAD-dependent oxidoreductase [Chloroflexota bacterium]|nr:NAD(P)/FAD-dependent oxidoreductase [Chloroflexota bacterium]
MADRRVAERRIAEEVDCVVIGGGPAGLSASNQVARLGRSCLLVDDDRGRSLWSQTTRNYLGFPDGIKAADLRLLGQRQATNHGVILRAGHVAGLRRRRSGAGFDVIVDPPDDVADSATAEPGLEANQAREQRAARRLDERQTERSTVVRGRTVILATGVADRYPAFAGRDACVGISLFWCPVCDGYEARGRRVAVVGDDDDAVSTAFFLARLSDRVTLVTNRRRSRLARTRQATLETHGVPVIRAKVEAYEHDAGQIRTLHLHDGAQPVEVDMVFVSSPRAPRSRLARRLGARHDELGYLTVDSGMRTTVAGLYAAGDVLAGHPHQVGEGAATGAVAATAVNYDLTEPSAR